MAEDLKPCPNPWCVSMTAPMPIGLTNGYGNRSGWVVQCGCGVKTHRANTRHAAISGWNTRQPPPDRPDLADLDRSAVSAERPGREAWVLQRNNHPFAVYFDHAEGNAALAGKREAERQWYEENRHIADVRTYWNLYKADQGVAVPATPDA